MKKTIIRNFFVFLGSGHATQSALQVVRLPNTKVRCVQSGDNW